MRLSDILKNINIIDKQGSNDTVISGLTYDSRLVKPDYAFFALTGIHTNGHKYIEKAIQDGATAIFYSEDLSEFNPSITYIKVNNTRRVMSQVSSAFYRHPSQEMTVIGVTGTDGKSSTVSFIDQLLELSGYSSGYLSTVAFKPGDAAQKNQYRQSTPESNQIHEFLRRMRDNNKDYAIVESTSHGLSEKNCRLIDVDYNIAVLTNVTSEHLEFHGTIEQYREDKANLFRLAASTSSKLKRGIINQDDPHYKIYEKASEEMPLLYYSRQNKNADLFAHDIAQKETGTSFSLSSKGVLLQEDIFLPIPGLFNIENIMAALLAVSSSTNHPLLEFIPLLKQIVPVKGRMAVVECKQPFSVIVDYAHTPGAFEKIFPSIKENCRGRLISVFGSAGERDTKKRPIQGSIASKYSNIVILTDEDPRGEDSTAILEEIAQGCSEKTRDTDLFLINDRIKAIEKAVSLARENDTIIILGKGHEATIEYKNETLPWDDIATTKEALKKATFK